MCKKSICCLSCLLMLGMAQATLGDLVAHWALNEGVGSQVMDSTGNGNTGNIVGNPTWINGVFGGALEFHGLGAAGGGGDYINCGAAASLDITTNISIALWIRPDADQPESKGTETAPMAKAMSNMSPSWSWQVRYGWGSSSPYMAFTFDSSPRAWAYVGRNLNRFEWCHIACSHDGSTLRCYLNGEEAGSTTMSTFTSSSCPVLIGSDGWGCDWIGAIDDVRIYNHGLTVDEIAEILAGGGVELAKDPSPADAATDVPCDAALSWTAGVYAVTHDVYLGTTFDDVNNVGRDNAGDLLVSQGQEATEYVPQKPLDYGQTYYWRVDEVNDAPDNTIFKGTTWSFTTEPYGYPMTGVTAKASNEQTASPAIRTVDGSGLDELDQHGTDVKTMWVGSMPASIVYTFNKEYKLHELWVWNANSEIEAFMGFGVKDVTVEYSTDGETWTALQNVPQFAQATGTATYMANTVVPFGSVAAKYVRLTVNAAYGATGIVGLSEVRFFYVPTQAFGPDPADGATGVSVEAALGWRSGREATSHAVTIDTDEAAVAGGTAAAHTVATHGYTPSSLDFATKYFWKVDEIGDSGTYAGDVWSFTTQEYAVVDDFESYNDDIEAETTIWHAWIDGLTNGTGSYVGYDTAKNGTFAETVVVHGGSQSMPLTYDNSKSPYYSEVEKAFASAQNWTVNGADTLSLYFRGVATNSSESLYVTVKDNSKSATVTHSNAAATQVAEWQQWKIPLSQFTSAGVKVTAVKSLAIGVGNKTAAGTGVMYFDDIGFGRPLQ